MIRLVVKVDDQGGVFVESPISGERLCEVLGSPGVDRVVRGSVIAQGLEAVLNAPERR